MRSVYQPIVELETGALAGYEALARGPAGSPLERPDALFGAAGAAGCTVELDWACRAAALEGALSRGLAAPASLFVNVEPGTLGTSLPPGLAELWSDASTGLRIFLEVTERALTDRPAELLGAVARARALGWGIALDDVGADPRSLALMPFLRPDVIKLDLRLVQGRPTLEVAKTVNAVRAESERTGAAVLAEGIETDEHRHVALALGATLGQGYLFGRPGELGPPTANLTEIPHLPALPSGLTATPYDLIGSALAIRRSTKPLLIAISKQLEAEASSLGDTCVIVSAFQQAHQFTELTRERYTGLAGSVAFAGVLAAGLSLEPAAGVRGTSLRPGDRLRREWNVSVLGPHFAAALAAVDLGDTGPDNRRRFDYALTFDRSLAVESARLMVVRIAAVLEPSSSQTTPESVISAVRERPIGLL